MAAQPVTSLSSIQRGRGSQPGRTIATRISGDQEGENGLFYIHSYHASALLSTGLGSTSVMSYGQGHSQQGEEVLGSIARYLPFGDWRVEPGHELTDQGFTGQKHNMDLGLYYYNARFYLPGIGRFASADTIVPDPMNPQQFNRYTYTLNNPLRFTDPSGHCTQIDHECWEIAEQLYTTYGWYIDGIWTVSELQIIMQAGVEVADWFARHGGGDALGRMRGALGGTHFSHADLFGRILNRDHVRGSTIYLLDNFNVDRVLHELAHVLDNHHGLSWPIGGAAFFGGGLADHMANYLGGGATQCSWNRSSGCAVKNSVGTYDTLMSSPLTDYARNGPSEDFADSFKLSVQGELTGPRAFWFLSLGDTLNVVQSEYTGNPYYSRRYVAPPVPNVPIGSGGGGGYILGSPLLR